MKEEITDQGNQIQAIQYENVGLQGEIRTHKTQIRDLIANRHVPRCGVIDTVFVAVEKNEEHGKAGRHPYYMVRCQNRALKCGLDLLLVKYPTIEVKEPKCEDANDIHCWNRFKRALLGKVNYYKKHFSLIEEHREFFEDFFDIEMKYRKRAQQYV